MAPPPRITRRNPPRLGRPPRTPANLKHPSPPADPGIPPPRPTATALSSSSPPADERLRVYLRILPLPAPERERCGKPGGRPKARESGDGDGDGVCLVATGPNSVALTAPQSNLVHHKSRRTEIFDGFAAVLPPNSSQHDIFTQVMNPLVDDFLGGKSGLLVAMGPTGSGKTHTVFGTATNPGIVPLTLNKILNTADSGNQPTRSFFLSMFEIVCQGKAERILDLLSDAADLVLQQSAVIKGLKEVALSNFMDAESLLSRGMLKRSTAPTSANSESSRSQCIIIIRAIHENNDLQSEHPIGGSVLTIAVLAGAQRKKSTGNMGSRLLESNFINNTSMVFGNCLRALLDHQKNQKKTLEKHFKNSMLTRYLRDYLEGRKKMTLILNVKPGDDDYLDTSYLLRQASPYMKIRAIGSTIKCPLPESGADRISALPDYMLQDILSLLPAQEAVQTCVLARRWRHLWRSTMGLRLVGRHGPGPPQELQKFVDNLLKVRAEHPDLHNVEIKFISWNYGEDLPYVSLWIRFVLMCKVRSLTLHNYDGHLYLDGMGVASPHLRIVDLAGVVLQDTTTTVHLDFASCSALENLKMHDCDISSIDKISCSSLKHLSITGCIHFSGLRLHVSAPSLISLKLDGFSGHMNTPSFENMVLLETAYVNLRLGDPDCTNGLDFCFWSVEHGSFCGACPNCNEHINLVVLGGISSARHLELISELPIIIFAMDLEHRPIFSNVKTLVLNEYWCVAPGGRLAYVLKNSPVLEKLTLELFFKGPNRNVEMEGSYMEMEGPSAISEHLKIFEVMYNAVDERKVLKFLRAFKIRYSSMEWREVLPPHHSSRARARLRGVRLRGSL